MATGKAKKKDKLRHAEYYDFQAIQDKLYADSNKGKVFKHLVEITLIFSIVFMSVIMIIPIVLPFFSKSSPKPSHETTSTHETSKSYEKPSNETSALVYTPPKKSSNETSAILYTPKETKKLAVQPEPLSG